MARFLLASLLGLGLDLACGDRAWADPPNSLTAGSRVRVTTARGSSPASVTGRLAALDVEKLVLELAKPSRILEVPLRDISKLELSKSPSRKGRGALVGFGVGLATAFALEAVFSTCEDGSKGCASGSDVLVYGTLIVALPGAAIGAAVSRGELWVELPVKGMRVGAKATRTRGLSVSLAARF